MPTNTYLNIKYEKEYLEIAESIDSKAFDSNIKVFLYAIINRSMVTCRGIETLIRVKNYESALPLLRVVMDCVLQVKAMTMAKMPIEYCKNYGTKKVRKEGGKSYYTETEIADSLKKDRWVDNAKDLYKFLCAHVHLSSFHYGHIVNETLGMTIGDLKIKKDERYSKEIELCYDDLNNVLLDVLYYCINELLPSNPRYQCTPIVPPQS